MIMMFAFIVDTHNLGSTRLEWNALFTNEIKNGVTSLMSFPSSQIDVKKDLIPASGVDLGSSGSKFANLSPDSLTDDGSQIICTRSDNTSEVFDSIEGSSLSQPLSLYRSSASYVNIMTFFSDNTNGDNTDLAFGNSPYKQLTILGDGSIYPDNTIDGECGVSGHLWAKLHSKNITDNGSPVLISNPESLIPTDNTYDLGGLNNRWNEAYFQTARVSDSSNPTLTIHNRDTSISVNDVFGIIDFRSSGNYFGTQTQGLSCGRIDGRIHIYGQKWIFMWSIKHRYYL
eukprot:Lithocolla_globosa_v1_NODE_3320_length_1701_cov_4.764277.p1 type:complete len:286 gc:universal NODE_3320_length_1701_cov_4.764277:994-137(-)